MLQVNNFFNLKGSINIAGQVLCFTAISCIPSAKHGGVIASIFKFVSSIGYLTIQMKSGLFIFLTLLFLCPNLFAQQTPIPGDTTAKNTGKVIFAYGGQLNKTFLRYIITLTNKKSPKICFLPTASGDNPEYIGFWNNLCKQLSIKTQVLRTFSASSNLQTFEEQLLQMDIIIVGGGNAVNMLAIWKAQGIDTILQPIPKAL